MLARLVFLTVFWFWLGTIVLRRQAHVTRAIGFWVVSAALCGSGAILQFLAGDIIPNTSFEGGDRVHPASERPRRADGDRLRAGPHAGLSTEDRRRHSVLVLCAAPPRRGRPDLSGSIGALVAVAAAVVVWLAFQRTTVHILLALATLAACAVALTAFQSARGAPDPLDRFRSVTSSTSLPGGSTKLGSVDQRIVTYRVAIERIKEDPFVGVGLDLNSVTRPFGVEAYDTTFTIS